MKYSVCTEILFGIGGDLPAAMERVKAAGFDSYEFWFWWIENRDMAAVRAKQEELGLTPACLCAKFEENPGDASRKEVYLDDFKASIAAAKAIDCKMLIVQAGYDTEGISREEHRAAFLRCMEEVAALCEAENITAVIEPLNIKVNHQGYHLYDTADSFEVIRQIGSPKVKLLFDIYHQQISSGNVLASIEQNLDLIGHIHIAGVPGRHEFFQNSELDYRFILRELERMGYQGTVGLEYEPALDPDESLKAAKAFLETL